VYFFVVVSLVRFFDDFVVVFFLYFVIV